MRRKRKSDIARPDLIIHTELREDLLKMLKVK